VLGFLVMRRRITRRVFSSAWVALDQRLNVIKCLFIEGECVVIQRDFPRGMSNFKSSSGIEVEARQPESTLQALL